MIVWTAKAGVPATVRAWFGANGTGVLDLFERSPGQNYHLLASNPSVGQSLVFDLHDAGRISLSARAIAGTPGGGALPVFIEVSQQGAVVVADDGTGQVLNGPPPTALQQDADADDNAPTYYYFEVEFV